MTPNKEQLAPLMDWQQEEGVDFWQIGGVGRVSKVMVSPEVDGLFATFLQANQIQHELFISDVEPTLQRDKALREEAREKRSAFNIEPNFEVYWTFDEIEAYAIDLAQQHPNLVHRDVFGISIEGRDLFGLRISSGGGVFGRKPIIFIDSGVHAREWVGPQATLYLINQLVTNTSVSNELLEKVDWVIVPMANPDGFVYSHTNDRLWRKNRRFVNGSCTGVDLNRNFAYQWQYLPNSVSLDIYNSF